MIQYLTQLIKMIEVKQYMLYFCLLSYNLSNALERRITKEKMPYNVEFFIA